MIKVLNGITWAHRLHKHRCWLVSEPNTWSPLFPHDQQTCSVLRCRLAFLAPMKGQKTRACLRANQVIFKQETWYLKDQTDQTGTWHQPAVRHHVGILPNKFSSTSVYLNPVKLFSLSYSTKATSQIMIRICLYTVLSVLSVYGVDYYYYDPTICTNVQPGLWVSIFTWLKIKPLVCYYTYSLKFMLFYLHY